MSHVTSVVLLTSEREEDSADVPSPPIAALQAWLRQADVGQLIRVDHLFGGWKHPQTACWGGGLNHLDVKGFLALFRTIAWRHPEQVVLLLTTEEEPTLVMRAVPQ